MPIVHNKKGSDRSRRSLALRTVLATRLAATGCRFIIAVAGALLLGAPAVAQRATAAGTITVDITPGAESNSFVPAEALGAGIDRLSATAVEKLFTKPAIDRVLSAGWQTVSYRQNTELFVEAWHWNPEGTWSDPGGKGYFTGSTSLGNAIQHSYGYLLPHRGVTRNDGTDSNGYSRLTDGDLATYWKSNPYLSSAFTGEDDARHPQWVTIDLASALPITTMRIVWAEPYARQYLVQYWTGEDPIKRPTAGSWATFPGGVVTAGVGGTATLSLNSSPVSVQFLRIWMTESSNTCDGHGADDRRNCVGYAIRELYLGTQGSNGEFYDLVRHTADQDQTATICSSIDPVARAGRHRRTHAGAGRTRSVLHERLHPRTARDDSGRDALQHAGGCRSPDQVS